MFLGHQSIITLYYVHTKTHINKYINKIVGGLCYALRANYLRQNETVIDPSCLQSPTNILNQIVSIIFFNHEEDVTLHNKTKKRVLNNHVPTSYNHSINSILSHNMNGNFYYIVFIFFDKIIKKKVIKISISTIVCI